MALVSHPICANVTTATRKEMITKRTQRFVCHFVMTFSTADAQMELVLRQAFVNAFRDTNWAQITISLAFTVKSWAEVADRL